MHLPSLVANRMAQEMGVNAVYRTEIQAAPRSPAWRRDLAPNWSLRSLVGGIAGDVAMRRRHSAIGWEAVWSSMNQQESHGAAREHACPSSRTRSSSQWRGYQVRSLASGVPLHGIEIDGEW